ncbi:hypothetical protein FGE12_24290 [Aggregicoccus sp. 17bor-14]|uniref:Tad domain-containing protein n=1 Tax=Myxococcaceae TaxID=31 RepID=UPI00129D21B8|nr:MULTISPECIES: Tad domain-containing protein [Myxococcaceae]MBF5045550.1 Tad domain-containing protein [Simulacricoccus sp. 17bor-14]MRI91287.1 hypothetical protein [Aggregicoccus sp. 17bor-14]
MLTRSIRNGMRRQEGQALVMACLLMLVLAIAVLTTVNIGHNVSERIRLQNTADSAAYSMAAMEARAFNFYAYANRTQVSHYVSAMMWQSLLSLIYFAEAFFTDMYGFMRTLSPCGGKGSLFWKVACKLLEAIPVIGEIIIAIEEVIDVFRTVLVGFQDIVKGLNPDKIIGKYVIPAHRTLNSAMFFASQGVMYSTSTHILQTVDSLIAQNDPDLDPKFSQALSGLASQCLFNRAHFEEAGGRPLDLKPKNPFKPLDPNAYQGNDDRTARAKRVMGNITNASRYPCDSEGGVCPEGFVTSRQLGDLLPLPDSLKVIKSFLNGCSDTWCKMGQTRFLTRNNPNADKVRKSNNFIREWKDGPTVPMGMLAQGDNMGSDDIYWLNIGPDKFGLGPISVDNPFSCGKNDNPNECWGDPRKGLGNSKTEYTPYRSTMKTSIWAMNEFEKSPSNGGVHWRVNYAQNSEGWAWHQSPKGPEKDVGVNESKISLAPKVEISVFSAFVRPVGDGNHPWKGIVPFMHFEPMDFSNDNCSPSGKPNDKLAVSRHRDFNQPSTWVALSKSTAQLRNEKDPSAGNNVPALLNDQGTLKYSFGGSGGQTLVMENNRKGFLGYSSPFVIARGQTYYHRPGNWAEQPNFFNPYWRPRLASVYQGLDQLPLLDKVKGFLGPANVALPKIVTH